MKFDQSEHSKLIYNLVDKIQETGQADELIAICSHLAESFGMDYFSYVLELPSIDKDPQLALFSNYTDSWLEDYTEKAYFEIDPAVSHCTTHVTPLVWDSGLQYKRTSNNRMQSLMSDALDHDVSSGVAIPIQDRQCQIAGFNLASKESIEKKSKDFKRITPYLSFYSSFLHERMLWFHNQEAANEKCPITPREADCLSWAASGKTAHEIAGILNVSAHTVNFHIKNAIKKLNSANKTHAVAKAITFKFINPELK